jgi:hypothetical protein
MQWSGVEQRIRKQIIPGSRGILKCSGMERRSITSNTGEKIGMRTGVRTRATKAITYDMLEYAFGVLQRQGEFTCKDFRSKFPTEYANGPCRYSMTGGALVEVEVAKRDDRNGECYYRKR